MNYKIKNNINRYTNIFVNLQYINQINLYFCKKSIKSYVNKLYFYSTAEPVSSNSSLSGVNQIIEIN